MTCQRTLSDMQGEATGTRHPESSPGPSPQAWASVHATSILGLLSMERIQAAWIHSLFLRLWLPRLFSRDSTGGIRSRLHLLLQVPFEEANLVEHQENQEQQQQPPNATQHVEVEHFLLVYDVNLHDDLGHRGVAAVQVEVPAAVEGDGQGAAEAEHGGRLDLLHQLHSSHHLDEDVLLLENDGAAELASRHTRLSHTGWPLQILKVAGDRRIHLHIPRVGDGPLIVIWWWHPNQGLQGGHMAVMGKRLNPHLVDVVDIVDLGSLGGQTDVESGVFLVLGEDFDGVQYWNAGGV